MPNNSTKTPVAKTAEAKPRKLKVPKYKSFTLQKKIERSPDQTLPSAFKLLLQTFGVFKKHWKLVALFLVVFASINLVVAQSAASPDDIDNLKTTFHELSKGDWSQLGASAALLVMLGTGSSQGSAATSYQLVWMAMGSLAFIWLLRELYADNTPRIRDTFYKGMYPLVPFLLVLLVMGLQLLPAVVGGTVFSTLVSNGIAATFAEQVAWGTVCLLISFVSLYWLSSSVFALYIACLPNMTPLSALRSARALVEDRRSIVLRKVLFLPFALFIIGAIIMTPLILVAPWGAVVMFFILNSAGLLVLHGYFYRLYRALL